MANISYEESKSIALKTILILAAITVGEVLFALLGKGYLIEGFHIPEVIIALVMITLTLIKAAMIIFEFMHMKYEVPVLAKTVLLPTFLLVWGVIAFLYEGHYWKDSREGIKDKNEMTIDEYQMIKAEHIKELESE